MRALGAPREGAPSRWLTCRAQPPDAEMQPAPARRRSAAIGAGSGLGRAHGAWEGADAEGRTQAGTEIAQAGRTARREDADAALAPRTEVAVGVPRTGSRCRLAWGPPGGILALTSMRTFNRRGVASWPRAVLCGAAFGVLSDCVPDVGEPPVQTPASQVSFSHPRDDVSAPIEARGARVTGEEIAGPRCDMALALNGTDGIMVAPVDPPDPFVVAATLAASVYLVEKPTQHIFHIVGKPGVARDLDLQVELDGRIHFYVAAGVHVISRTVVSPNTWYRVVATYQAGDRIALYIDGALDAERMIPGIIRTGNMGPIAVGESSTFEGRFFHGFIDDVGLWNRALSAADVAEGAALGDCRDTTLVAAYPFERAARDCSSHGHDGKLWGRAHLVPLAADGCAGMLAPIAPP